MTTVSAVLLLLLLLTASLLTLRSVACALGSGIGREMAICVDGGVTLAGAAFRGVTALGRAQLRGARCRYDSFACAAMPRHVLWAALQDASDLLSTTEGFKR